MQTSRIYLILLFPVVLVLAGTVGYVLIEGWSLFDALYMTVITLTTVGYREVHELSRAGQVFTMLLALGGIFTLFYAAMETIRFFVSGEAQAALGRRRMERTLAQMQDHLIVCGLGRMGRLIGQQFASQRLPMVVIEKNEELLENFTLANAVPIHGDATSDEILRQAGIERARALVAVVGTDADNLYITMSARLLNERLFIVARAEDERSESKLLRAGASRVVSPYVIGGARVAQAVLRPTVMDFIELATSTEHLELQIDETRIAERSPLAGKTIQDSRLRRDHGLIIVAIKKPTGQMVFNPPPETVMAAGDILIALGNREHTDQLVALASGAAAT